MLSALMKKKNTKAGYSKPQVGNLQKYNQEIVPATLNSEFTKFQKATEKLFDEILKSIREGLVSGKRVIFFCGRRSGLKTLRKKLREMNYGKTRY